MEAERQVPPTQANDGEERWQDSYLADILPDMDEFSEFISPT
jgi:hypothetical protein